MATTSLTRRVMLPPRGFCLFNPRDLGSKGYFDRNQSRHESNTMPQGLYLAQVKWNDDDSIPLQPLYSDPVLFRTFSSLDTSDEEAILAFANKHGQLGVWINILFRQKAKQLAALGVRSVRADDVDSADVVLAVEAESVADWKDAIESLRDAVEVADLIRNADRKALRTLFRWTPAGPKSFECWSWARKNGSKSSVVRDGRLTDQADVLLVAETWLWLTVNHHLSDGVMIQIVRGKAGNSVSHMVPKTLVAAVWLQLHDAITKNKNYRACVECEKEFEISNEATGRTVRSQFCGDVCRVRNWRKRKDRVEQLHASGSNATKIAQETGEEPETVKKWLSTKKEG